GRAPVDHGATRRNHLGIADLRLPLRGPLVHGLEVDVAGQDAGNERQVERALAAPDDARLSRFGRPAVDLVALDGVQLGVERLLADAVAVDDGGVGGEGAACGAGENQNSERDEAEGKSLHGTADATGWAASTV